MCVCFPRSLNVSTTKWQEYISVKLVSSRFRRDNFSGPDLALGAKRLPCLQLVPRTSIPRQRKYVLVYI
jgi:hypothetical protein